MVPYIGARFVMQQFSSPLATPHYLVGVLLFFPEDSWMNQMTTGNFSVSSITFHLFPNSQSLGVAILRAIDEFCILAVVVVEVVTWM